MSAIPPEFETGDTTMIKNLIDKVVTENIFHDSARVISAELLKISDAHLKVTVVDITINHMIYRTALCIVFILLCCNYY